MDPSLLKAIQKGGGKAPSKVKGKAKKKAPPRRPDQKVAEKQNPNAGRVVGKNHKPKASGGSAASGPPRPPTSNPQNNALLGNILAARQNMKKKGKHSKSPSGGSKSIKPPKPSPIKSPANTNKWSGSKKTKSPNTSPNKPSPKPSPKVPSKPSPDSSPVSGSKKKWGFNKKNKSPKPSPKSSPVPSPKASKPGMPPPNPYQNTTTKKKAKSPSIMPSVTSPTSVQSPGAGSSEVKRYKERIAALEKENEAMKQKLSASEGKATTLMEKLVETQTAFDALKGEHKVLKQQFEALKSKQSKDGGSGTVPKSEKKGKSAETKESNNLGVTDGDGGDANSSRHKKKGSKWKLFSGRKSKENLIKDLEAEPKEKDDAKTEPAAPSQPVKSIPPPKASGLKKPMLPKDNVVPKLPPRPPAAASQNVKTSAPPTKAKPKPKSSNSGSGGGTGGGDPWSAYIAKHSKPPASASQLQNFSKSIPDVTTLNFKQAREMFNANK